VGSLVEDRRLRDKRYVFADRRDAGKLLSGNLLKYKGTDALILAIPSGGVPVATEIAKAIDRPMDLIIVRKLQIPFNPEAGFGAMGPDGEVILNEMLLSQLTLTGEAINVVIRATEKVIRKRNEIFRRGKSFPQCKDKCVIIVDDGLASGFTMLAAIRFIKRLEPSRVVVAVPTASERTLEAILPEVDELLCLNVRTGFSFAVADAYRNWYDLTDREVLSILENRNDT
jgi:predicted phosphoribosyltransferase